MSYPAARASPGWRGGENAERHIGNCTSTASEVFPSPARSYHANIGIRGSPISPDECVRMVPLNACWLWTMRRLPFRVSHHAEQPSSFQSPIIHPEAEAEVVPFMLFSTWRPRCSMEDTALTNASGFSTSVSTQIFSFSTSFPSLSPSVIATSPTKSLSTFGHQ
jgi:hypothetical protein